MTEGERLDQIVKWISELSGQLSALQHQVGALRVDIEAMRYPHHLPSDSNQYWIIVAGFMIAAAIIAATLFYVGAPR